MEEIMLNDNNRIRDCRLCKNLETYKEYRYRGAKLHGCTKKCVCIFSFRRCCPKFEFDPFKAAENVDQEWYKDYKESEIAYSKSHKSYKVDEFPQEEEEDTDNGNNCM